MHCVLKYPAKADECNLKSMLIIKEKFKLPVGFSDHTIGIETSISAVALGAEIIEKHFTLDKTFLVLIINYPLTLMNLKNYH